jgi:uncharacterized OB-fold protein
MQNDFLFALAERQHLEPPSEHCPICGSIDLSADRICRHCNSEMEEFTREKRKNFS